MSISLKLDTEEITKTANFFKRDHQRAMAKSFRGAITKALPVLRQGAQEVVQDKYNIGVGPLKHLIKAFKRVRGNNLHNMFGGVDILPTRFGLMHFSKTKKPLKQKGKKVKSRQRIKVEIRRGRTIRPKGLFIAKGKDGFKVFRRQVGAKSTGRRRQRTTKHLKRQSVPAPVLLFGKAFLREPIERKAMLRLQTEFERLLPLFINKLILSKKR